MTVALNQLIPMTPDGAHMHPSIPNVCAFEDGRVFTFDPRIKSPVWYELTGILNMHGRRQSQIAKKMRLHYQVVFECLTKQLPKYHSITGHGLTIDHIDGDKDNNAFSNLRLLNLRENVRAASLKSGLPYAIRQRNNSFRVCMRVSGKMQSLGTFPNMDLAIARRDSFLTGVQQ